MYPTTPVERQFVDWHFIETTVYGKKAYITVKVSIISPSLCYFRSHLLVSENSCEKLLCHITPLRSFYKLQFDELSFDKLSIHTEYKQKNKNFNWKQYFGHPKSRSG